MSERARLWLRNLVWATVIVAGSLTAVGTWWALATASLRTDDLLVCLAVLTLALCAGRWPLVLGPNLSYQVTSGVTVGGALLLPAGYTSAVFAALLIDRLLRDNRFRSKKRSLQATFSMCNNLIFVQLAVLPVRLLDPGHHLWPLYLAALLTTILVASVPANALVFLIAALDTGTPWRAVTGNTRQTYIADLIVTYLGVLLAQLWRQPWNAALVAVAAIPGHWLLRKVRAVQDRALHEQARAKAAEELAQLRSAFVAAVSHELRTPLTAIIGYAELLEAHWASLSDEARLAYLQHVLLGAKRQRRLVDDLLVTSRLERGQFSVDCRPVELAPQIALAISEVCGGYPGQQIETDGPDGVMVLADSARLVQILVNVLDNAAKYSPQGSQIEAYWTSEDTTVTVRIRDHGRGIPEAGRAQLFTRFGRLPGSVIRAGHTGTGLGLYLAAQFATAMGGTLDLESSGPQGSTFRLRLPRLRTAAAEGSGPVWRS